MNASWTYDTATKGIGKLATATTTAGFTRAHHYDGLGRNWWIATSHPSIGTYNSSVYFDGNTGRPDIAFYPSGEAVKYSYYATGYQNQ